MKPHLLTTSTADNFMLPCLNKQVLGVECPGCGIQRAGWLLAEGDFAGAFLMYPGIYPLILLLLFLVADRFFTIRHASRITAILAFLTVGTILTNYLIKIL